MNNNFLNIDTDNYTVSIRFAANNWDREAQKKVRIYVSGEEAVDFTEARAMQEANGYGQRGDNSAEDKLFDKLNRQVVKNKRAALAAAIDSTPELAELIGGLKVNFSKHAGCSMCPCSPGFIGGSIVRHGGDSPRNRSHQHHPQVQLERHLSPLLR